MMPDNVIGRTIAASVSGGAASALGGGKFANGAVSAAFTHLFNTETQRALSKSGIRVNEEFTFTESDARKTLIAWAKRAKGYDAIVDWVNNTTSLTNDQMTVAFNLAANMSNSIEIAELMVGMHLSSRSLKGILKVVATESSIRNELIEHLNENCAGLDSWSGSIGVTAGTMYMRTDYKYKLYSPNGHPYW